MTQPSNPVNDLITMATQMATASVSQSSNTFPVYTGTTVTNPVEQTGGNILVGGRGHVSTDNYFAGGTQAYFNKLVALQQTNNAAYIKYQQALYANNFYGNSKPLYGQFTAADTSAFTNALTQYGTYLQASVQGGAKPITFEQYLANSANPSGGPTKAPLTVQYTDPASLTQTLQAAAQDGLGRNLNDAELQAFISHFHGQEKSAQTAAYNNASSVTPPDAGAQAKQYILTQHGPEHDQKLAAGYLDSIYQRLNVNPG